MKKILLTVACLFVASNAFAYSYDLGGSATSFTTYDPVGDLVSEDTTVFGNWTGETGKDQMSLGTLTPFFGLLWTIGWHKYRNYFSKSTTRVIGS